MADKKLLIKLAADVESLKKDLRNARKEVDIFSGQMKGIGSAMAGIFSAKVVGEFALEVSKLAGEAQGVREAFNRLPQSVQLMNDLKVATHGTVSELDLMKRSVMAANFDISLKALPQLLEFATIRAKQTGQSIDYLVDSIVTGIGRKSKLILDNLGISAVQLTEALGGASTAASSIGDVADAVGKIAEENLKKMGTLSENASTKLERLNAEWINMKVAIGDAANGTGVLGAAVDSLIERMRTLSSKDLSFWEKFAALMSANGMVAADMKRMAAEFKRLHDEQVKQESITRQANQALETFGDNLGAMREAYKQNIHFQEIMNEVGRITLEQAKKQEAAIRNEKNLTEEVNGLREEATLAVGRERAEINLKIKALEQEIAALQKLGLEEQKRAKPQTYNFKGLAGTLDPKINDAGMSSVKDWIEAMAKKDAPIKRVVKDMEQLAEVSARVGDAIGQGLGDAISGAKSFAQAMAQMASSVVASIERVVLARMIENSFKYAHPLLAIGAAAAGFGIVKSLFNRIGNSSGGGGSNYSNHMPVSRSTSGGMNVMEFHLKGKDLVASIRETTRYDSRVKTVYS